MDTPSLTSGSAHRRALIEFAGRTRGAARSSVQAEDRLDVDPTRRFVIDDADTTAWLEWGRENLDDVEFERLTRAIEADRASAYADC